MNRYTWILLLILFVLAGLTFLLTRTEDKGMSQLVQERKFTVEDIEEVEKIFVAARDKPAYLLEKKKGFWTIDGDAKAHQGAVDLILDVIKDVRIQYVPTPQATKNAIKTFAAHGIKVEVYGKQNKNLLTYYIGGVTQTEDGTYFIREGADQPFVMELPYFTGNLRTRFDVSADDIKHRLIYEEKLEDIQSVCMEYPANKAASFVVKRDGRKWIHQRLDESLPASSKALIPGGSRTLSDRV